MELESVKATLTELVESAGENGITETQAAIEIGTRYKLGCWESIKALKSVYNAAGVERTPEHTGKVISYKKKQEKQPEKSAAERMAINSARRTAGELQRQEIINQYRR